MQQSKRPSVGQLRDDLERTRLQSLRSFELATKALTVAAAMREDALDTRVRTWTERLAQRDVLASRDNVLQRSLDAAISVASSDYANIQLAHRSRRGLEIKAQRGFGIPFLDFFEFVEDRCSACGLALLDRRPIVVDDVVSSPVFAQTQSLDVLLEAGVRAVQSTPLIDREGGVLGVLSVHYREPRVHADGEVTRLQALATAVSASIRASLSN